MALVTDLTPWIAAGVVDLGPYGWGPGDWVTGAVCPQTDPATFDGETAGDIRLAKRVCARCDVQAWCLAYALVTNETAGVWGGMSRTERQRLKAVPVPGLHGVVVPIERGRPRQQVQRDETIDRLTDEGKSSRVIAGELGIDVPSVQAARKRNRERRRGQAGTTGRGAPAAA